MQRIAATLLSVSGFMVSAIGLAHFFLPTLGYDPAFLADVPEAQRDHFVNLGTYAIGSFLLGFGVITLFSQLRHDRVFLGTLAAIWVGRFGLELAFPVKNSLFFVPNAHPVLMTAIPVIALGYIAAFFQSLRPTDSV